MGAAQYVGRVGGLAVALGVGLAIFSAAGTASAETDDTSSSQTATSTSNQDAETKQHNTIKITSTTRDADESEGAASGDTADDGPDDAGDAAVDRPSSRHARAADTEEPDADDAETDARSANDDVDDDAPSTTDDTAGLQTQYAEQSSDEQGEEAATSDEPEAAAALTPGYNPAVDLVDGVITGSTPTGTDDRTYTVVRTPSAGGKVSLDATTGDFTFLPYLSPTEAAGTEKFSVLVAEQTAFTQALQNIEIVKDIAPRILVVLQQVPIVKDLLSPLIGRADRVDILIDVSDYVGEDMAPIAFTTKITSFDGVRISVNYFPKSGLGFGDEAPTILNGPSLATAGYINLSQPNTVSGLVPGISQIRENYNVVTWDPRGEFASGGRMHLDSELFEARDVSEIISWVAGQPGTDLEGDTDDPLVGMVGGSYGGGIQLTSAGIDSRIDAIAPGIAWNSLNTALYPNNAFKTSWASLLALSLAVTGARPDLEIYAGIFTGVLTGFLTPGQQRFLSENSPDTVVGNITAPTLFLQGTVDGLFVLEQALANAEALNGDVPVQMIWYCGGHGWCLDLDDDEKAEQTAYLTAQTLAWMDTYVLNKESGGPAPATGPEFVWVDQNGDWFTADNLPIDLSFYGSATVEASGAGGVLPLVPILGGSGPQTLAPFPLSLPAAAESGHALEVTVSNPDPESGTPLHVVGAPSLTFTYSGLGTSRHVYAQLVDNETHRVLGNLVTPIPVTLDGRQRTVTFDMENIAYTMGADDSLTLQIVDSATAYEDFTSFGLVTITDVSITLPTADVATPMTLPPAVGAPAVGPASPSVEDVLTGGLRR
ncbi:hypothetical protein BH10ACT9_BH10ACT9_58850 [soil metagenome]